MQRTWWPWVLVVVLAACGPAVVGPTPTDDGGAPPEEELPSDDAGESDWTWDGGFDELDAGEEPVDAGALDDAGTTDDAGTVDDAGLGGDAGFTSDAGAPDAGRADAGAPDAGAPDAGRPDAGTPDAGRPDAGLVSDAGLSSTRQRAVVLGATDAGNGYFEYLPPGYGDGTPRPLLVFWHGIDQNGDGDAGLADLSQVLAHGPPKLIARNAWPNTRPFVVLSPQHRGSGCPGSTEIRNFIAYAARNYAVDPKRLYLTGLSCGAIGSWNYIGGNLDAQIAGAVLIAGDPGKVDAGTSVWGRNGCNLGRVPIWSFHGDADTRVVITNDRDTMLRLIACPQPPREDAIFTVYPGVNHDSWTRTYDLDAGHDIYGWLLQQAKP